MSCVVDEDEDDEEDHVLVSRVTPAACPCGGYRSYTVYLRRRER